MLCATFLSFTTENVSVMPFSRVLGINSFYYNCMLALGRVRSAQTQLQ